MSLFREKHIDIYKTPVQYYKLTEITGTTYTNHEIAIMGKKLIIRGEFPTREYGSSPNETYMNIKLNQSNSNPIQLEHETVLTLDFTRVFFSGKLHGTLHFYALSNRNDSIEWREDKSLGGNLAVAVAAGNAEILFRRCLGIQVESFGNVVVTFGGTNATFSNVPAGTFLPIAPSYISNTTTSDIVIIYKN